MNKKILLGCYEVPGWGGASTGAYRLFRNMNEDGLDISYINIIDIEDVDFFRYVFGKQCGNPENLDCVYNCELEERLFAPHPGLENLIQEISPNLIAADGYIAALLMKRAAPEIPLIFLTAGINQIFQYLEVRRNRSPFTLDEFMRQAKGGTRVFHHREKEAIEISDFIITHSELIRDLTLKLFPYQSGKVYSRAIWRAEFFVQDALDYAEYKKPFIQRDIDLLFVANSWLRPVKNYQLVKKIIARCKDLNIHIVGEFDRKYKGVKYHGFVNDRREMFSVLGNAKMVVNPSLFDTAPGVLFEASAMGCNLIASKNCGNWMICNANLLVDPFSLRGFQNKIYRSLDEKLEDNLDYFLQTQSYQDLIDTIMVF